MLDSLFRPKSVAVIGASTRELHIGNRVIKNLLDFGFKGPIYPINPKADEIRGIKAYKSIMDVPEEDGVDVVHMVIPAKLVPLAFEDCGKKGVKNIIINSGGFSEIGPAGEAIQNDFMERAKKYGIRVLGPNCQGIINSDPDIRAYCNFTFTKPDPGHISITALSGGVAEVIHQAFAQMGIGTRIYASNGNACDITIPEIVRYLGNDDGTRTIILYVEGLRDAATFMEVATEVAAKKPVLAMKAGRTELGAKAASSHTGGLAKADIATELIFKKAGILGFRDEAELCQAAVAFASQPIPKGNRVGIITNTGGPAVIATDVFGDNGLEIPPLSEKAISTLRKKVFPEASVSNPTDLLATGLAEHYRAAMDMMMEEEQIDSIFINFVTPFFVDTESIAKEIAEVNKQKRKPIICNLMTDPNQWGGVVEILKEAEVPCYNFPGEAARALSALVKYNEIRSREIGEPTCFNDVDKAKAAGIIEKAKAREILTAAEVYEILEAYRIPVAGWGMAANAEDAEKVAGDIGYPVVIKADSETIVHKSDMGGVAVNLEDGLAVRAAVEDMERKLKADDLKFFIQKYMPGGKEIIIGAKAEEGLGHLIMFGLGGIYVEVLKDVVFNLTPVTKFEAEEMLSSIKTAALLEGVRGEKGVDRARLVEIIQRLSQLVTDLPAIQEMDLNPVIAYEDKVFAVDARIAI
ncbi:acetate--CoA ligase family protein [Desulfonema magnum]|uniref:CoA-binding domain-containing protein n=1 Tax=Desulfonema magnum TaxID=45655 RepID=A0A975GMD4_9BACT|nr:acetate--CoA ligase [Desulfonema magnum]QTA86564.1 CoA-binding domain-containing protein [Desulfonema magnum]